MIKSCFEILSTVILLFFFTKIINAKSNEKNWNNLTGLNSSESNYSILNDDYKEYLYLRLISKNLIYSHSEFIITLKKNGNESHVDHLRIFPSNIYSLTKLLNVSNFQLSMTQGRFFKEWGHPIINPPIGARLSAKFDDKRDYQFLNSSNIKSQYEKDQLSLDKKFDYFARNIGGLFSLALETPSFMKSHDFNQYYCFNAFPFINNVLINKETIQCIMDKNVEKNDSQIDRLLQYEDFCIENLHSLTNILPCNGLKGIFSLYTKSFFENLYYSFGVQFNKKRKVLGNEKIMEEFELKIFISSIHYIESQNKKISDLFGGFYEGNCPITSEATFYIDKFLVSSPQSKDILLESEVMIKEQSKSEEIIITTQDNDFSEEEVKSYTFYPHLDNSFNKENTGMIYKANILKGVSRIKESVEKIGIFPKSMNTYQYRSLFDLGINSLTSLLNITFNTNLEKRNCTKYNNYNIPISIYKLKTINEDNEQFMNISVVNNDCEKSRVLIIRNVDSIWIKQFLFSLTTKFISPDNQTITYGANYLFELNNYENNKVNLLEKILMDDKNYKKLLEEKLPKVIGFGIRSEENDKEGSAMEFLILLPKGWTFLLTYKYRIVMFSIWYYPDDPQHGIELPSASVSLLEEYNSEFSTLPPWLDTESFSEGGERFIKTIYSNSLIFYLPVIDLSSSMISILSINIMISLYVGILTKLATKSIILGSY